MSTNVNNNLLPVFETIGDEFPPINHDVFANAGMTPVNVVSKSLIPESVNIVAKDIALNNMSEVPLVIDGVPTERIDMSDIDRVNMDDIKRDTLDFDNVRRKKIKGFRSKTVSEAGGSERKTITPWHIKKKQSRKRTKVQKASRRKNR